MTTTEVTAPLDEETAAINWAARQVRAMQGWADQNGYTLDAVEIASANQERVEKALKKVRVLCAKYGQPDPRVMFSPTSYTVKFTLEQWIDGERCYIPKIKRCQQMVTISPAVVGKEGWRIVAKVTHLDNSNAVVATFPGETIPEGHHLLEAVQTPHCDHCNTTRRRNETFVVATEDDADWLQVGKDCLQEFMGISPAHALALAGFYEATGVANNTDRYEEPLEDWLSWVAVAVRLDGRYWSKAAADEANYGRSSWDSSLHSRPEQLTTVNRAHSLENAAAFDRKGAEALGEVPTDADRETVERVKAWALALADDGQQYTRNLLALFRAGILVHGTYGLAASAFAGYLRDQRKAAEAAAQENRPVSKHVGTVGERLTLRNVRVVGVHTTEGDFGTVYIYGFQTQEGDVLKWFSSNDMRLSFGQELTKLTGTVKKFSEWQGRLETVLTRCRIG